MKALLVFLSLYGTKQRDIVPAFVNYYQDITGGQSLLGNLTLVDGESINLNGNFQFEWIIDGVTVSTLANPTLDDLSGIECDGVVQMTLRVTDGQSGSVFSRTQWAYLDYNYTGNCDTEGAPSQFEVFYEFFPVVEPYHYQVAYSPYDVNENNSFDSSDLLSLLSSL